MRRPRYLAILLAALALVACGGTPPATVATAPVTRGELVQSVSGSGQIKPAQDINLNFGTSGAVAAVRAAEGQKVKKGDVLAALDTAELDQQVLQAQANLKSAQAGLADLKAGPKETDIRGAKAQLAAAQAQLAQQLKGNARATDIANAQAQLRSAQASLAALKNPTPADLSAAQLRVTQAQTSLQNTRDADSAAKNRADLDLQKAVAALTQAQSTYATASQNWQHVQDIGTDPINPNKTDAKGKPVANKLNDAQRQQYYDAFVKAEAGLHSAEDAVQQAQITFDNARQKEATDIQQAEAQLADAQRQLDALQHPSRDKTAAAEAKVAQARAQLNQLSGGTTNDVAVAQSNVEQRQAALDALNAPPSEKTSAQAEASIAQAEAALSQAKLNRSRAEIVAPFDATIATINIKQGDTVGASAGATPAIYLVDDSAFHVDVNISEADLVRLKTGQTAEVELDALPGQKLAGTVSYIAPTATVQQNVTTYLVRIALQPSQQQLHTGLSAAVSIVADRRANALLVPNGAIQETDNGPAVQVKRGNETATVKIKTGLAGDTSTEVLEGSTLR